MGGSDCIDKVERLNPSSLVMARRPPGLSSLVDGLFFALRNLEKACPKHMSSQDRCVWWWDMCKFWRVALTHSVRTFGTRRRALSLNTPLARRPGVESPEPSLVRAYLPKILLTS